MKRALILPWFAMLLTGQVRCQELDHARVAADMQRGLERIAPSVAAIKQETLEVLLRRAEREWGVPVPPISIRWESIGPCQPVGFHTSLREMEQPVHLAADVHPETVEHWIEFEDGTQGPHRFSAPVWVILLNTSCDWSQTPLNVVILHEVGHALGLQHVADRKDVMFPAPGRKAKISRRDREMIYRRTGEPKPCTINAGSATGFGHDANGCVMR